MAIDLDKMRSKLEALQNRGQKKDSAFWRPEDGEQTIRIVPTPDGDPFKEYWFHYNLGKNPGFLSPKRNFGIDDPLNDFVRQLFNEGTEDSIKMAKDLMARQRFFAPVLVRGEEEKGVRIWGFGKMAYQELLNLVLNPEYGDITDVETGTDLVLKYGKPPGAQFPQTTLTPDDAPRLCVMTLLAVTRSAQSFWKVFQILMVFLHVRHPRKSRSCSMSGWLEKTRVLTMLLSMTIMARPLASMPRSTN
jgi:hypothetical protein